MRRQKTPISDEFSNATRTAIPFDRFLCFALVLLFLLLSLLLLLLPMLLSLLPLLLLFFFVFLSLRND